jgi:hypothetical protein
MIDSDPQRVEQGVAEAVIRPLTPPRAATWRYLGERAAADDAYCARFGVSQAPEPSVGQDKVWSYALPVVESPR